MNLGIICGLTLGGHGDDCLTPRRTWPRSTNQAWVLTASNVTLEMVNSCVIALANVAGKRRVVLGSRLTLWLAFRLLWGMLESVERLRAGSERIHLLGRHDDLSDVEERLMDGGERMDKDEEEVLCGPESPVKTGTRLDPSPAIVSDPPTPRHVESTSHWMHPRRRPPPPPPIQNRMSFFRSLRLMNHARATSASSIPSSFIPLRS